MKLRLILMLTILGLVALACAGEQKLGTLIVDTTSVPMTLKGEINQVWSADVKPGSLYEIKVVSQNLEHSLEYIDIVVFSGNRENLADPVISNNNISTAVFKAPESGHVRVEIYSLVGERGEDLGTITVQLQKLES